ncbi:uncharacterized protein LOC134715727 [Mytilus trossulus]|uniref:uncharacterized protein LOC134715727 n=1 Tax=Mytilus trossulus TaxID=6551 RepID=UPI00300438FB
MFSCFSSKAIEVTDSLSSRVTLGNNPIYIESVTDESVDDVTSLLSECLLKRKYKRTSTMSSQRSSVRPPKSKMPWGTILKPEFGMGHQKMTDYEIEQTVDRLYKIKEYKERYYERTGKKMSDDEISEMLGRMTKVNKEKIVDSDRRVHSSIYKDMGIVSSYAWKGYN